MRDPLQNLKREIDEQMSKSSIPSQKEEIMQRIHRENKKRHTKQMLHWGLTFAALILIGILGSPYVLSEMSSDPNSLPSAAEKNAPEPKVVEKEPEGVGDRVVTVPPIEEQPNPEPAIEEEVPKSVEITHSDTIDLEAILANPDAFMKDASEGHMYGTDFYIGMSYEDMIQQFGQPSYKGRGAEMSYNYEYGDYFLNTGIEDGGTVKEIFSPKLSGVSVNKLFRTFGEGNVGFNEIFAIVQISYKVDEYYVIFDVSKGDHQLSSEPNKDTLVEVLDHQATITRLTLWKKTNAE